jgi:hypothetical protein
VRTRLAAIAAAHRLVGVDLDLRAGPIATLLMGFKREQGTKPLKQATPLHRRLRKPMARATLPYDHR